MDFIIFLCSYEIIIAFFGLNFLMNFSNDSKSLSLISPDFTSIAVRGSG